MSADDKGPCFHCEITPLIQQLIKRYPNKPVPAITMELTDLLADYVACTAPPGELSSAIVIIQRRFSEHARAKREEAIKVGWVTEVTVQ